MRYIPAVRDEALNGNRFMPPKPSSAPPTEPLLSVEACARLLSVSPDTVDRLRLHAGLPAVDLGFQHPGRRAKHLWRFDPVEVRAWWLKRMAAQAGEPQAAAESDAHPP